jgi:hypothetical protein
MKFNLNDLLDKKISELNFNKYKYRSRIKYSEAILNYPELFND